MVVAVSLLLFVVGSPWVGPAESAAPSTAVSPSAAPASVVRPEHREQLPVLPPDELDLDKARALFAAGKQAAEQSQWEEAIRYFAEAYRYSESPGQLYSLGRGHRELYFHDGHDPVQLRLAILRFEQYLERSPSGRNRDNARRYIDELTPYANVLEGFDEPAVITRLMVHGPQADAVVSVDDGPSRSAPITLDVKPGRHRVRMSAPGFHEAARTVDVPAGATVPLEIQLDEQAAELQVDGPAGAEIWIDGQRVERLPLSAAITLGAGPHQVAVAQAGRTAVVRELEFGRGEQRRLSVALPMTAQRTAAYATMGIGAGSLVASGVLGGLALRNQARARAIERERETTGISEERYAEERDAWARRDSRRVAAVVTGALGAAALGTGLILYFTDVPRLGDRLYRPERAAPPAPVVRVTPTWAARSGGVAIEGRF